MSADTQPRRRAVQGRTGFQDWNNHMTCVQVRSAAEEVAGRLEALAVPGRVTPRSYQAALELTWGLPGVITVRSEAAQLAGPITVSRPLPGPTPETCVIWLEASPAVCSRSALYDLGVELQAALALEATWSPVGLLAALAR